MTAYSVFMIFEKHKTICILMYINFTMATYKCLAIKNSERRFFVQITF